MDSPSATTHRPFGISSVGLTVFIGGPIQHLEADSLLARTFEAFVRNLYIQFLSSGHRVYSAHIEEDFGRDSAQFHSPSIAQRDFKWMSDADVFLPVLPELDGKILRTDGTHVELGWATAMRKPIALTTFLPLTAACSQLVRGLRCLTKMTLIDYELAAANPASVVRVAENLYADLANLET